MNGESRYSRPARVRGRSSIPVRFAAREPPGVVSSTTGTTRGLLQPVQRQRRVAFVARPAGILLVMHMRGEPLLMRLAPRRENVKDTVREQVAVTWSRDRTLQRLDIIGMMEQ